MKKILVLILSALLSFSALSQDIPPISPLFKALKTPQFSIYLNDTTVWVYLGDGKWINMATQRHLVHKVDSLGYHRVPYENARADVNLGDKKISSTKQRLPLFNGSCVVPSIVDNNNGSITVSAGEYHLSTTPDGRGTESFVIAGGTFALTDQAQNYLVADYNFGTPVVKVITDVNLINETTITPIYTAYRNGIFLHFQNWDALGLALANKVHQSIVKTQRYRRDQTIGGILLTEYGTHNLKLSAGRVWVGAVPVDISEINTDVDNLSLWYHSGGNWVNSMQATYNFTQWDNGTNLVTLTNNRYAVNWVFRGIESQKHLYIVLGNGDYSLVEAEASSMPPIPTAISSHATLVAKLIVEKNAATATNIKSAFEIQFSLAAVQKHNDLVDRDALNSHPASAISNTPSGNISSTNVQAAITELDAEKEPLLTKGLLTETVDGLELSSGGTRQVIGGAETITLTAGRVIPTTTNISHAETAYTHSQNDTDLSPTNEANTSLTYNQTTRVLSVTDPVATRSVTLPLATTTVDGLMSKTDKIKLDAAPSSIDSLFVLQFDQIEIKYGYLYNWYVASDTRNAANTGWHVAGKSDYETLAYYCDPDLTDGYNGNNAGYFLKESGSKYWLSSNTGINSFGFNGRGAGIRSDLGAFSLINSKLELWNPETMYSQFVVSTLMHSNDYFQTSIGATVWTTTPATAGRSLRLVKDATTLSHGQVGTYTGNDGRIYRTICIGTQEWLADNLAETKYRNGDLIPMVTDNAGWAALTTGARCSYNNIESNALAPILRDITINDTIYFDKTILGNSSQLEPLRVDTTIIATKHYVNSSIGGTQTLSTDGSAGNISISSGNTITLNVNDHTNRTALDNVSGINTGDNATNTTSNSYADGKVQDTIVDGVTTIAPSQNTVYDALAGKVSKVTSTDNALVRFNGTGGDVQNSGAYLFDSGNFYIGSNTENLISRMLIKGGANGANLDIMGDSGPGKDQATVELGGYDFIATSFKSLLMQYHGPTNVGTSLGYPNNNLGKIVFGGDYNLIFTSNNKPLIFGIDNAKAGMIDIDRKLVIDSLASASSSIVTASTAGKLNKATFTTTGNSGAATFSLNNLNIPHYTLAGLGAGTAANNNTGDFILNQNSSVQNASIRILKEASFGGRIFSTGGNDFGNLGATNGAVVLHYDSGISYLTSRNYSAETNLPLYIESSEVKSPIFNSTSNYQINSTPLLLDWLKSGSAPASGNIVIGNGTTTNPSGVSVNQAIGGNALTSGYLPYWDGSKLVNSLVQTDGTNFGINSPLYEKFNVGGNIVSIKSGGSKLILANSKNSVAVGSVEVDNDAELVFFTQGSNERLRILQDGNVKTFSLSGTGTRLVSATSDGTLGSNNITTDASNNLSGINNLTVSGDARINSLASDDKAEVSVFPDGTLTRRNIAPYYASSTNYTLNVAANVNAEFSAASNITITLSNIFQGERGVIEVTYTGSSVVTFIVGPTFNLKIDSEIYNSTTNEYTKSVLSKSSGVAKYEYYRSGNNVFIDGKQIYQ